MLKSRALNIFSVSIEDFTKKGNDRPMVFEQLPFDQPLYILYSSGTSGPPKCIVHSAGVDTSFYIIAGSVTDKSPAGRLVADNEGSCLRLQYESRPNLLSIYHSK